jgi:hypothetical protein
MRILAMCALALVMTGCAVRGKEGLPKAADPLMQSKVDDTFRGTLHSNDPARDQF